MPPPRFDSRTGADLFAGLNKVANQVSDDMTEAYLAYQEGDKERGEKLLRAAIRHDRKFRELLAILSKPNGYLEVLAILDMPLRAHHPQLPEENGKK